MQWYFISGCPSVYLFLDGMFPMGDPKKDQELGIAKICLGEWYILSL